MVTQLRQEKCPCKTGTLKEIVRTPPSYDSDAYVEEYRTIYFECDACNTLYNGRYTGRGSLDGEITKYHGRLSKRELENIAKKGYEELHIAELEKVIETYNNEKTAGTLTSQIEIDLLKEVGYTDTMIDNLTRGLNTQNYFSNNHYSSVFEYFLNEGMPLRRSWAKNRIHARKNMNRILGANIY
jgi:hypothetical protein